MYLACADESGFICHADLDDQRRGPAAALGTPCAVARISTQSRDVTVLSEGDVFTSFGGHDSRGAILSLDDVIPEGSQLHRPKERTTSRVSLSLNPAYRSVVWVHDDIMFVSSKRQCIAWSISEDREVASGEPLAGPRDVVTTCANGFIVDDHSISRLLVPRIA